MRTVALFSPEVSFQSSSMRSFLLPPRWNLSSGVALAAHIFIRHLFFSALEDKASSVSGVKRGFNAISLAYSPAPFPLHVRIIFRTALCPSFFLFKWLAFEAEQTLVETIRKDCTEILLLQQTFVFPPHRPKKREQCLSSCSQTTARMFTPLLYHDPQFWDGA